MTPKEPAAGPAPPRLFVEAPLATGAEVALNPGQAHHLGTVLRLRAGAPVLAFNGHDGEWRASLAAAGRGRAALTVRDRARPQHREPDVWLVFAPVKRARIDFIAQKAAELGASALWPVLTDRTIVQRINTGRLRANAVEAAEQTGRLSVPSILAPAPLEAMAQGWPAGRRLYLCDESGCAPPIAEILLAARTAGPPPPSALLTGPEGGFAERELDRLRELPFVRPVGLGGRLLRADTAALAALACWQAIVGDWSAPQPRKP